jgi:peptide/nickel transport system substrate-binding protein
MQHASRTRSLVVITAVGAALALAATACGSTSRSTAQNTTGTTVPVKADIIVPTSGAPKAGGSIVYAVEGESDGWNPTTSRWSAPALTEANTVFDPLAAWGPNYDVQPYLAESFTHNADYTVWDIKVRPGITFHDGEKLDAAAVKQDLDTVKKSVLTGTAFGPVTSVSIVDDLTVAVHMNMPWSVFPATLTAQVGLIAAPRQLTANDTQHPVGTGPFVFSSWVQNSTFVVKKNPDYWRHGLPYLDQVTFRPIPEVHTMYDALSTGDIDMMETSSNQIQLKMASAAKSGQIQLVYSRGETEEASVMLNTSEPPVNDLSVRQAIAYATDHLSWAKAVDADPANIADGPFAPGSKWYISTGFPTYDLAKAKALVAQYVTKHGSPPTFTLQCTSDSLVLQTCQILQNQWERAGMQVKITTTEQATLISNALQGAYQATIWRQFGGQDPDFDSVWWNGANTKPPLALNMARNVDPKIDAALYVGRTSDQKYERQLAYITVARQLAKDLPYIWLSHTVWTIGARNDVRGFDDTTLPNGEKTNPVTSGVERLGQIWLAS